MGSGKSTKVDVKEDGTTVDALIEAVKGRGIGESHLWFNGKIETLGQPGFMRLREAFPAAVLQCPVDFAGPLAAAAPQKALDILSMISEWGVNRLSVKWETVRDRPPQLMGIRREHLQRPRPGVFSSGRAAGATINHI